MKGLLNRRLGPVGLLVVALCGIAAAYGLSKIVPKKDEDPVASATPTPTVTACTPAASTFGAPPDTFTYDNVDAKTRTNTIKALGLDQGEGKVEMVKAARGGLTLGQLVGVPDTTDPAEYASSLVAAAQGGGVAVERKQGYAIVPLQNGQKVAVGVRGCDTILISAQDPNAVRFLAETVFTAS